MEHDIQSAIDGNANYLAALGLISYTEVTGGLIRGTLKKGGSRDNFEAFMAFFHKDYARVNSRMIKDKMSGLYYDVRCGLVHEYFMKGKSMILMHKKRNMTCGISYRKSHRPILKFVVEQYFDDFKDAFKKYESEVKAKSYYAQKFNDALNSVNSVLCL